MLIDWHRQPERHKFKLWEQDYEFDSASSNAGVINGRSPFRWEYFWNRFAVSATPNLMPRPDCDPASLFP